MDNNIDNYWSIPIEEIYTMVDSSENGLSSEEAKLRLLKYGENIIKSKEGTNKIILLISQFKNPIIIILLVAIIISIITGDIIDSLIILGIVVISLTLSFFQEYSANNAIEELKAQVQAKSIVLRDGLETELPSSELVYGDIVRLSAGSLIPADGIIIESNNCFVNQAVLTGESIPIEKIEGIITKDSSLEQRNNTVFMGTNILTGSAKMIIIKTAKYTQFGKIADDLEKKVPMTEFEIGIQHFGYLLSQIMLILTLIVFASNVITKKSAIESLLFSVALAVGITPQLLPAIISITLAKGSKQMAKEGVIVRRLNSIENFGSMDILCTDKTGTLTEGIVSLDSAVGLNGEFSEDIFKYAYINAKLQTGLINPLDKAIIDYKKIDIENIIKVDELTYDFYRKRLSIIVEENNEKIIITKGALKNILSICNFVDINSSIKQLDEYILKEINLKFQEWSSNGFRVLGISKKLIDANKYPTIEDEKEMIFIGFLLFLDTPKEGIKETIEDLRKNKIELKVITGDNKLAAMHTAKTIGFDTINILTGTELGKLNNEDMMNIVEKINIFAEVDPSQKENIILALKKRNHVVGYMGDGINDVPSLHAADIGISVDTAVDVAKESADFVLAKKSLKVLNTGIELGRKTFENTMKYIMITTSANFGNIFSMAGASIFMPFLPLLPKQILLINFLSDFPAINIAYDNVDDDILKNPRRWNIKFIRNFMFTFGAISSIFDYITFAILLIGFKANESIFQSSWFLISILTELMVLLLVRTRKKFYESKPSPILSYSALIVALVTIVIVYLPVNRLFGIVPIPINILFQLIVILILYIITTEIGKYYFYKIIDKK